MIYTIQLRDGIFSGKVKQGRVLISSIMSKSFGEVVEFMEMKGIRLEDFKEVENGYKAIRR